MHIPAFSFRQLLLASWVLTGLEIASLMLRTALSLMINVISRCEHWVWTYFNVMRRMETSQAQFRGCPQGDNEHRTLSIGSICSRKRPSREVGNSREDHAVDGANLESRREGQIVRRVEGPNVYKSTRKTNQKAPLINFDDNDSITKVLNSQYSNSSKCSFTPSPPSSLS